MTEPNERICAEALDPALAAVRRSESPYKGQWLPSVEYRKGDMVTYRPEPPRRWKVWEWIRTRVFKRPPRDEPTETRTFVLLEPVVTVEPIDGRHWRPVTIPSGTTVVDVVVTNSDGKPIEGEPK